MLISHGRKFSLSLLLRCVLLMLFSRRFRRSVAVGAVLSAASILIYALVDFSRQSSAGSDMPALRQAFARGEYESAITFANNELLVQSDSAEAAWIGARSCIKLQKFPHALNFLDHIPPSASGEFIPAQALAGEILLTRLHQMSDAEQRFRRILETEPENVQSLEMLTAIFGLSGRHWEQIPFRLRLIALGRIDGIQLMSLALAGESLENAHLITAFHQDNPTDPLPLITFARIAEEQQQFEHAELLLRTAVSLDPNLIAAQVNLGKLLLQNGQPDAFLQWHAALPPTADSHPGIWILRGDWTARHESWQFAVRSYGEAIRIDPNDSHSNYRLGRLLQENGLSEKARAFFDRAESLRKFVNLAKAAASGEAPAKSKETSELAAQLGLQWEAYSWAEFLRQSPPPADAWAAETADHFRQRLKSLSWTRCEYDLNPIRSIPLEEFPIPTLPFPSANNGPAAITSNDKSHIRFVDQSNAAHLNFQYFNGSDSVRGGLKKMYEFAGGGIAIPDFDCDGLPDIYLAQGSRWPAEAAQTEHIDRLFRNIGDGTFEDVTESAALSENRFSHGASVGDFNSDGWPDLFVANIGRNRLYQNNTDGTFSDVTGTAGVIDENWTTSCLMADVNGDGHADLYEVNYLSGEDLFTRVCLNGTEEEICLPQRYPAEQDRLWLSRGDGAFDDATDHAGIVAEDGKGLGVIAADFDGSGRLSLFIANDTTPNFYFHNEAASGSDRPLFSRLGLTSGLALNGEGKTESCMGVAADDVDGDGRIDLFVTNFSGETNTLYRQTAPGLFEDRTRVSGLATPSVPMVGFGAQFLDADLDGWPDLLITNGHIDDFRNTGAAYFQMPPQCYRNHGQGEFRLLSAASLGPYFEQNYLGRALARCDWNRDGREDAVVTHLDAPVALLTNATEPHGGFLSVCLHGTESNRDAIGTVVTAAVGERRIVRQLSAGDGYLTSNERQLIFGLESADIVDTLSVEWPNGRREQFRNLKPNSFLILVEGRGAPYSMP